MVNKKILGQVIQINLKIISNFGLILLMGLIILIFLFSLGLLIFEDFLLEPDPEVFSLTHVLYLVLYYVF